MRPFIEGLCKCCFFKMMTGPFLSCLNSCALQHIKTGNTRLNPLAVHEPHQDECLGQNENSEVPFSPVICLPSLAFALQRL